MSRRTAQLAPLPPVDITKNATEILRIEATSYKGYKLCALRIYYRDEAGELKPTRKGVTFKRSMLDEVIPALRALQEASGA